MYMSKNNQELHEDSIEKCRNALQLKKCALIVGK